MTLSPKPWWSNFKARKLAVTYPRLLSIQCFFLIAAAAIHAQLGVEPWLSVGEQPRGNHSSPYESAYLQGGALVAYYWPWLRLFGDFGISPIPIQLGVGVEGLVGVGFGHAIGWLKPMLTLSAGYQTVRREKYLSLDLPSDEVVIDGPYPYVMQRRTLSVSRIGMRVEWLQRVWVEFEHNVGQGSAAIPQGRVRLGYHHHFRSP
jgi:hypothetical protein